MAPKKNDPRDMRAKKDTAKKDEKPAMRPMAGAQKRPPAPARDERFGEEE